MPFARLPETVQTLYAELLDELRAADAEAAAGAVGGSLVSKRIRGRVYWYLQRSEGTKKRQIYLGPDESPFVERVRASIESRSGSPADQTRRRELVAMLAAGGMFRESASIGTVLRVLADASVFRAGGVLVGTQAFTTLANMLGVTFEKASTRTADVDVAHDTAIPVALDETRTESDLLDALRASDPGFFAVPGLDVRAPSTSFSVRGRDLRVDFLTPDRSRGRSTKPVVLRHLGCAAQPLPGLDYLTEEVVDAAVLAGSGVRVNVPQPARFVFHKLWVAAERPVSEAAKARKDLRQAAEMLEVLVVDRPGDVTAAYAAFASRRTMRRRIAAQLTRLDSDLQRRLDPLLQDA
ncbi:MAG: GSU2403 family nucleotidyltransferase fold protein, partial [Thermoanaerobaculia bacterium]